MREASDGLDADPRLAVARLYESHRAMLVRLATFLCSDSDAAEEIVQDAFAGLQQNWHRLVVNGTRNLFRRHAVARRHLRVAEPEATAETDYALLLAEEQREVILALRDLPRRQREVLVLRYWSELGEAEIAAAMGISRGTVKSTASRALSAVERRLKEHR